MGMSIDEAMANLSMYSVDEYGNAYTSTWYKGIVEDMENSFELAIDTMRKYQKIEEIVNDRYGKPVFKTLDEVIKVVEDGND